MRRFLGAVNSFGIIELTLVLFTFIGVILAYFLSFGFSPDTQSPNVTVKSVTLTPQLSSTLEQIEIQETIDTSVQETMAFIGLSLTPRITPSRTEQANNTVSVQDTPRLDATIAFSAERTQEASVSSNEITDSSLGVIGFSIPVIIGFTIGASVFLVMQRAIPQATSATTILIPTGETSTAATTVDLNSETPQERRWNRRFSLYVALIAAIPATAISIWGLYQQSENSRIQNNSSQIQSTLDTVQITKSVLELQLTFAVLPTTTPTATATPSETNTATSTPSSTATNSPSPTSTNTATPTLTPSSTATKQPTATDTTTATLTSTPSQSP